MRIILVLLLFTGCRSYYKATEVEKVFQTCTIVGCDTIFTWIVPDTIYIERVLPPKKKEMPEEVKLFQPSKRDMKTEYPELATIKEFELLSNKEMLFVWHYANPTSDLVKREPDMRKRALIALGDSELINDLVPDDKTRYVQLMFPERITVACRKMETFIPSVRTQGKMMQEIIFDNYYKLINADISKMDDDRKKQYIDLAIKVSAEVPKIIVEIEDAYGVKVVKYEENTKTKGKLIDRLLDDN